MANTFHMNETNAIGRNAPEGQHNTAQGRAWFTMRHPGLTMPQGCAPYRGSTTKKRGNSPPTFGMSITYTRHGGANAPSSLCCPCRAHTIRRALPRVPFATLICPRLCCFAPPGRARPTTLPCGRFQRSLNTYRSSYSMPYDFRKLRYSSWKVCFRWCSF